MSHHAGNPKNVLKSGQPVTNTIWAIGGGKGGVGKSFISSSLAICLARLGKTVTIVDLDLGSANLHTCLGTKVPPHSLSDFLSGRVNDLNDLATPTEVPNLNLINGFNDAVDVADLGEDARSRLISALRALKSSYVILDLGAGTAAYTLDFFLAADRQIVACSPEPTAVENMYRFVKAAFYRRLRTVEHQLGLEAEIAAAMDSRNGLGIRSPADLINHVEKTNPAKGARLSEMIAHFHVHVLVNQVRTHEDAELSDSVKSVCRKYFGIEASALGGIDHDNAVWQSLRKRRPFVVEYPYSSIVGQFLRVTKLLVVTPQQQAKAA